MKIFGNIGFGTMRTGRTLALASIVGLTVAGSIPCLAEELIWSESFENTLASASIYPKDSQQQLELGGENAADGSRYLHTTLSGRQSVEGALITIKKAPGNCLVRVTAKVRGNGSVMLSLNSQNGWVRGPAVALTAEWQEVILAKTMQRNDTVLGLYFHRPPKVQAAGVLEIDDIKLYQADPLNLANVDVPPRRLAAADYAKSARQIIKKEDLCGVGGRHPFVITGLPFPQTSRDVTVYIRVYPGATSDRYALSTRRPVESQNVRQIEPKSANEWQWLKFANVSAEEVGDEVGIQAWASAEATEATIIDTIVFSTEPNLDAATLDKVH